MTDSIEFVQLGQNNTIDGDIMIGGQKNTPNTMPVEIFMVGLGNHGTRPTLFIRTESEMLIYRAFRYPRGKHLKIRFRKINHDIVIPRVMSMEQDEEFVPDNFRRIRYFGKFLELKEDIYGSCFCALSRCRSF